MPLLIPEVCSKYTKGSKGGKYIKVEDQKRHYVFIRIDSSKICEIITEKEFKERGVKEFVNYW